MTKSFNELHLGEEALGGLSAGVIGTVIGFPLDVVKTRMQVTNTKGNTIFQVGQSLLKQEGLKGLYRGLVPPLISLSILNVTTFTQYAYYREQWYGAQHGWDIRNGFAGMTCGPVSAVVSTVENLIKTQMQLDNVKQSPQYTSSFHCFRTLIRQHGINILYTGHFVNTIREMSFIGPYFLLYEGFKDTLIHVVPGKLAVPMAGGLAGASSWLLSFPLDCVRAGVQGQSPLPPSKGAWQVFIDMIQQRGWRGLYAGSSASIARAFLVSGSRFSAYEGALWLIRRAEVETSIGDNR